MGILTIKSNGRVEHKYWADKAYAIEDVTEKPCEYLFERCILDDDVTLRDIMLVLNANLEIFNVVLGNWCKEYVTEALSEPADSPRIKDYNLECLELYWVFNQSSDDTSGYQMPGFQGVGVEVDGQRIDYAIEFIPSYCLLNVPVKLKKTAALYDDDDYKCELPNPIYTLGHILMGIIWELSFTGSPENRDEFKSMVDDRIHTAETRVTQPELSYAPWTAEQTAFLNAFQICGYYHPYTSEQGANLIATEEGWVEELGGPVVQNWVLAGIFNAKLSPCF
jgi:hypothetical protein